MPVVPGKPGSVRIRGTLRAQLRQVNSRCASILLVNVRYGQKVPPVVFLTEDEQDAFTQAQIVSGQLLSQLNT